MRVRSLVIALLLLSFLMPAAGAIYIPGQEIPDDGLYHIMSAEDGAGTTTPNMGTSIPGLTFPTSGLSGLIPAIGGLFTQGSAFNGFPAGIASSVPPAMPGTPQGSYAFPAINVPPPDAEGNIVIGGTIGHIVPPTPPGYWDNIVDLHTNMPVIGL